MRNISGCSITLRIIVVSLLMNIFCSGIVIACPTCIGTIAHDSPKFFSNDAYQSPHCVQPGYIVQVNASTIIEKEE